MNKSKTNLYGLTPKQKINSHHGSGSLGEKETSKNSSSANNEHSLEHIAEQEHDDQLDVKVNLDMSNSEESDKVSIKQIEVNYLQHPTRSSVEKKMGSKYKLKKGKADTEEKSQSHVVKSYKQQSLTANITS